MLKIEIPTVEYLKPETYEFFTIEGKTLQLEHSLISLSKWESRWKKAFLKKDPERTIEQTRDYVRCMTLTQNVNPDIYLNLNVELMDQINAYINDPMTATYLTKMEQGKSGVNRDTVTSELIYYWMVALQIPFECQKWHLNRLLTLIEVCNVKNSVPTKMSEEQKRAQASQWSSINAARRARLRSKG